MGTWHHEIFGNDTACDWAARLVESDSLQLVEAGIAAVLDAAPGALDADVAVEGLAAAETLARLRGRPGVHTAYTAALDEWVCRLRLRPPGTLVKGALAAIERIGGEDSELRELWDESGSAPEWLSELAHLRERLTARPRPPEAAPRPDAVAELVQRVRALRFELPECSDNAPSILYQRAVGGSALGDIGVVRDAIERMWQAFANMKRPSLMWDLAVRDATTLAMEGRLDEALAGLEAWRGAPGADEPGMFAVRAAGVCQNAGDLERMRSLRAEACAQAPQQRMWRLDDPLFEARAGSAEAAEAQLAELGDLQAEPALKPIDDFIRGVLACRRRDPMALQLLIPVAKSYADKCASGAAAWALGSAAIGWWSLALEQSGRRDDAQAVVDTIRPVLVQPHNALLVGLLQDAGLLSREIVAPTRPQRIAYAGPQISDHGTFRSVALRGVNALKWVEAQRRAFENGSGQYPFLIGDDGDLRQLLDMMSPPTDGGRAALSAAMEVDAAAWLKQRAPRRKPAWPRDPQQPYPTPLAQFDAVTQRLKPVLHVGLVDLSDPCELFARLGWGDWNECPAPEIHVAVHRYWRDRFGAEPLSLTADIVECSVTRPLSERAAALDLAREHEGYCPDIVEQGMGTTARLGSALLGAAYWYFWWD